MTPHLKSDFAASVRKEIDRYAVWEPGAPFRLGDYGVLRDRTLHKLGNIDALGVRFSESIGSETPYQLANTGTSLIGVHGSGSVASSALPAPIRAAVELRFNQEHGLFVKAIRSRVIQIAELRQVALKLRASGKWNFGWKLVTEVREVDPGTIIMGSSAGTALKVEGDADLLEQFKLGGVTAGVALAFTGEAAFQVVGIRGPIFMELCYLPRYFRDDVQRAAVPADELPEEPYVRLRTELFVEDDDEVPSPSS